MTTGEKLAQLRKKNNYTQEQLAELLSVSRQAISKWESDQAFPETEKLIKISSLYGCSVDYLLKDDILSEDKQLPQGNGVTVKLSLDKLVFERKSKKMIKGVPLWHINIGVGRVAKGIFSFGLVSMGLFSCGLVSMGLFSFGVLSLGVIALGTLALGIISAGAVAVGAFAVGGVAVGLFAIGGAAAGYFAVGGAANGIIGAYGDSAVSGVAAIGKTEAFGGLYDVVGSFNKLEHPTLITYIDSETPAWLGWAAELFKAMI